MRSERCRVGCLLSLLLVLVLGGARSAHADAPQRVALRVASESDRALLPRLRGQLSDMDTQLIVVEAMPLEAAWADQLARAKQLASAHDADMLVWCASAQPPGSHDADKSARAVLHLFLSRSERSITRELTSTSQGPLSSSELETAALLVRSALIAMNENKLLDSPAHEAESSKPDASKAPQHADNEVSPTDGTASPLTAAEATDGGTTRATPDGAPRTASDGASRTASDVPLRTAPAGSTRAASRRESEGGVGTASDGGLSPRKASRMAPEGASRRASAVAPRTASDGGAGWVLGAAATSGARRVDAADSELSEEGNVMSAPLRARFSLGAQLVADGRSSWGQRGLYARAGLGLGAWALAVYGVVSLASEIADDYFALDVSRHAVGLALERQLPLRDAWSLSLAAHAGALLLRRTSQAKTSAVVSYPPSLTAAFAFGPELALRWRPGRFGVALRMGLDVLPDAPRFESAGLSPEHTRLAHALWTFQPRIGLDWETALP